MFRSVVLVLTALVLGVFAAARPARATEFSDDLSARRARLMAKLPPDTMLVVFSAPPRVYSGDVDYEYHQDSNLYYLTGITQEDTVLVLMPGNTTRRELLFIKDRNPDREHWTGRLLGRDEAREKTGVGTVLPFGTFDAFINAMLSRRAYGLTVDATDAAAWFAALGAGRAHLAVALGDTGPTDALTPAHQFVQKVRDRYVGFVPVDVTPELASLREVKTPFELRLLTRAADISVDGQKAGMRAAVAGAFEYQVKAAIEGTFRAQGALSWAYPSVVGSGPNTTILHYPQDDRQLQAGDLVLVDAAANFGYQAADLTRTYPVNGTFSPTQRDIYELVLRAQAETIKAATPGATLAALHNRTVEVLKEGLMKLGLITDPAGQQYAMWFTHGVSHFIGLDVHDVGSRSDVLQPGMTFTIEPGLYIRQAALDALPKTAANLELASKIQDAVKKYDGIGVRIEDSFVMEATGARNLSAGMPKSVADVEAFLRDARKRP
jgi:Xaa-Pro aminopeptidase